MLGAICAACLRAGMFLPITEFIVGHGSLELPAIWISGGAGLLMAHAMLFPAAISRGDELRRKGEPRSRSSWASSPFSWSQAPSRPSSRPAASRALPRRCWA